MSLDLHDLQGNIVKAYPRLGYPRARYLFFRVDDGEAGRAFVRALLPSISTAAPWDSGAVGEAIPRPDTAINIAFSFHGLRRLGVPQASLQSFPQEFAMGMRGRRDILGDDGPSHPGNWDPIWRGDPPDIFVAINGPDDMRLENAYRAVMDAASSGPPGVTLLTGHRGAGGREDMPYQEASAIFVDGKATSKEHFGYTDGISNPYFKGSGSHPSNVVGGGKVVEGGDVRDASGWEPLETGEFLLGHKDEAFEYPRAPIPHPLAQNGTFMVYRKLHQNVASFDRYLQQIGAEYPGGEEELAAKFAGRWRNGAPLATFRTQREADEFAKKWAAAKLAIHQAEDGPAREQAKREFSRLNLQFVAFDYRGDANGYGCPVGSHTRRVHPRAALEYAVTGAFERPDALANRRRMIRRGLPYGDSHGERADSGDHGIIFMAINASIERQFEFVQQQWINYGNDFRLGNDKDPLLGNHETDESGVTPGRMVIERSPEDPNPPFFCSKLPRFVETRGGDYYFVPGMCALAMIGDGIVDPT